MGEITVQDDVGPLNARVKFVDQHGHDTQPDDTPQWSSSDESVATVTASDDGMSATVEVSAPGATVIEVKTVDDEGNEIPAQGTVTVQAGDVAMGSVDFDQGAAPTT